MKGGYKILWTDKALDDLKSILDYLQQNWTSKEITNFARRLAKRLDLLSINPHLFIKTNKRKNVRKSVLTKQITIYYKVEDITITLLTLFDTRQNPKKLKGKASS